MNPIEKKQFVQKLSGKLKNIISQSLSDGDPERAMAAVSACGNLFFDWNQFYKNDELEDDLKRIAGMTASSVFKYQRNQNVVMFYDDFGLDTRGLAYIYLRAILATGKRLIYVTTEYGRTRQEEIDKMLSQYPTAVKAYFTPYVEGYYCKKIKELQDLVNEYHPAYLFLYTTPWDSSGIAFFLQMEGKAERFQINLTDHAFWLGVNAFDKCLEFRNYGASISVMKRNIPLQKIELLPYYPVIPTDIGFQGFPFEKGDHKVLFSGGGLYKTFDMERTYYHMVRKILDENGDTVFLYAGEGDDSELARLSEEYPGRIFHIHERKDLFPLMQHIDVYLNTYPMIGGLMMQYAAMAGKPPLTLRHSSDMEGILLNQRDIGVEFDHPRNLIEEASHLLQDESYRTSREAVLKQSVISRQDFEKGISDLLHKGHTGMQVRIETDLDTGDFLQEYVERFRPERENVIARRKNICLKKDFPDEPWKAEWK